jgi:catechol 2,3-dioxygenase-like lactoylglutathione lyase family enzyme
MPPIENEAMRGVDAMRNFDTQQGDPLHDVTGLTSPVSRRGLLGGAVAAAVLGIDAVRAQPPAPSDELVARQLPLNAVGLEHIGTVVPDVTAAARFFGRVFNPVIYKEQQPPLRYYVTLDPGYVALGSRDGAEGGFIDHDCVLADSYDRAAMARRLELEGLPPGRFGVMKDADELGLQLLPIGGLAASTEPAGRIVEGAPLVRPRGLYRVLRYVSDLDRARDFYRRFFGPEVEASAATGTISFRVGPTFFDLQQAPAGTAPRIDRFCVNVAAGDYDAAAVGAAVSALGGEVRSRRGDEWLHFRSPEGIGVELRPVDPARMWGRS